MVPMSFSHPIASFLNLLAMDNVKLGSGAEVSLITIIKWP